RPHRRGCLRRLDHVRGTGTPAPGGDPQEHHAALCPCRSTAPAGAGRSAGTIRWGILKLRILVEHDLFGKPASTFPDHAQAATATMFHEALSRSRKCRSITRSTGFGMHSQISRLSISATFTVSLQVA